MKKKYQILRKGQADDFGRKLWRFVAHGATFTKEEAQEMCAIIERTSGDKTKIIAV